MYTNRPSYWGMGRGITRAVKTLLIANGIVFVFEMIMPANNPMIGIFGLIPQYAWSKFYIWQFVTYMFLHGSILHIFFNMYALWVFGCEVERMWGTKAFYRYYFITGVGAGLFHTLITPGSEVATIGASGAVMAVLTAFAMMFPNREITLLIFFIFPVRMRARTLALGFAGLSIFNGVLGSPDGIAHFAHLGGMLVGYLYLKRDWKFPTFTGSVKKWQQQRKMKVVRKREEEIKKLRKLVDQVLDRANDVGMENLTHDERVFLKRASKILEKYNKET